MSYDKTFSIEVAISYEDMGDQSSLSHQLSYFKDRILWQLIHWIYLSLGVFELLITNPETRFLKFKTARDRSFFII